MRSTSLLVCSLLLFGTVLCATRPFITLNPASGGILTYLPYPAQIAAAGNILVVGSTYSNIVSLLKRNSAGFYDQIGTTSVISTPHEVSTDGTWIAVSVLGQRKSFVFQINADGDVTNMNEISSEQDSASLISSNTLVVVNSTHLKTHEYDGAKWVLVDTTAFPTPAPLRYSYLKEAYRMTENTFIGTYIFESTVFGFLMKREEDKSWTLFDTFNITIEGATEPHRSVWNGDDTVIVSFSTESRIKVFTRQSPGQWTNEEFRSFDVGYGFLTDFGHAVVSLDSNNFLISAPYHNYNGNGASGVVMLMRRDNADSAWDFVRDLGRVSLAHGQFGYGVTANDEDVLVMFCIPPPEGSSAFNCSFYSHPACFVQPIDVTCASPAELDQCNSITVADVATLNNPQCGSVLQSLPEFKWSEEGVQFNITFSRELVPDVTCAVAMSCPVVPITNPPMSSTTPTGSSVPVAAPSAKVNSAPLVALDAIAFVGLAAATFMLL